MTLLKLTAEPDMTEEINGPYRFTVLPRPAELGGGWRVRGYETIPGGEEIEVYGSIFPAQESSEDEASVQALTTARDWLAQLPKPEYRDAEHYMLGHFARDAAARLGD